MLDEFYNEIFNQLQQLLEKEVTQQALSDKTGVSRPYICQLLNSKNGRNRLPSIKLETFFKLFPHAKIDFGTHQIGDVTDNSGQVVNGDVSGTITQNNGPMSPPEETASHFLARVADEPTIDDATKVKLLKLLYVKK